MTTLTPSEIEEIRKSVASEGPFYETGYEHLEDAEADVRALLAHIDALAEERKAIVERLEDCLKTARRNPGSISVGDKIDALLATLRGES